MKTLKFTSLALLIMTLVSFTGTPISIASSNDDNHLSQNDSIYSPPGYMNKDIQQARTLTDKYLANKDKADQKTEATQRDISQKVQVQAIEKPKAELKQKQSASGGNNKRLLAGQTRLVDSSQYNVKIGSGTDQTYKSGRLISEVINGTRHVYAGFDNVGTSTIYSAVMAASVFDDAIIIVRGGSSKTYTENIAISKGVTLYGGYNENGTRDLTSSATTFKGTFTIKNVADTVEINGFNISMSSKTGAYTIVASGASNLKIYNDTFNSKIAGYGIKLTGSTAEIVNNTFSTGINSYSIDAVSNSNLSLRNNRFNGIIFLESNINANAVNNTFNPNGTVILNSPTTVYSSSGNNYLWLGNYLYNYSGRSMSNNDYFKTVPTEFSSMSNTSSTQISTTSADAKIAVNATPSPGLSTTPYERISQNMLTNRSSEYNSAISGGMDPNTLASLLRIALMNKDNMAASTAGGMEPKLLSKTAADTMAANALALPFAGRQPTAEELAMSSKLVEILKNPTEDQKMIIESVIALLSDVKKIEDGSAQGLELAKASDDLLQMVAGILLAQALPDLLKQGDATNIKAIFSELTSQKDKIMLDYQKSTTPYYENMAKDMAKNISALQLNNILSPAITKEELSRLPPLDLDKILEKIRRHKNRTFEEEYILQQEAKYRKDYIDPSKKKLESDMKGMLKSFTERLSDVLKSTEKK